MQQRAQTVSSNASKRLKLSLLCVLFISAFSSSADELSARANMEDPNNPLVLLSTSKGNIFIELFEEETPQNSSQFLALIAGEFELEDSSTGTVYKPRYYDGMRFHKVMPGFAIQTGSPELNPLGGPPSKLNDEINATALGLASEMVLMDDAATNPLLNIVSQEGFSEQVLSPLYNSLGIDTADEVLAQENRIMTQLRSLTVKELYELQGYSFLEDRRSHSVTRGSIALANTGPNSNGPEFFITMIDAPWLNGRHTVIGTVVEGLDIVDEIGNIEIDPLRYSRLSTIIYSARILPID